MTPVRGAVSLLVMGPVAAVVATSAHAHGGGTHVGFVSTVSYIEPQVPGLIIRVIGGHERLSLRNLTHKTIVIFGTDGRPALRLQPGGAGEVADPRIGSTGPPPDEGEFVKNWRIDGEAAGEPFAIVGFLGYRSAAPDADADEAPARDTHEGTSPWTIAAAVGGAVLLAAALALPLRRRKGES
jgi:hypothetical protein